MARAQRHLSHDRRWRNNLVRIYSGDPAGSSAVIEFGGLVPGSDKWKGTANAPGGSHQHSRISHSGAPSRLFASLEFKVESRVRNSVARLARAIAQSVLGQSTTHTLSSGTHLITTSLAFFFSTR